MPHPDAYLFDLGNVLINWDPRHLYRKLIPDAAEMERFLAEVCNHEWNTQMDAGRPWGEAIEELVARHPAQAELIRAYRGRWEEMLGGAMEEPVAMLEGLRAGGRRLYAITNWSADTFAVARGRYDFLGWFEHIVVSGEIGMVKPDAAIFRHAIEVCGLDPARTLFIDDSRVNIESAARLGFLTHHFTSAAGLRAALGTDDGGGAGQ